MLTLGGATEGKRAIGNCGMAISPNRTMKTATTHAKTGRLMKN